MEIENSSKRNQEESQSSSSSTKKQKISSSRSGFFHLRSFYGCPDPPQKLIYLRSDRIYTIGRKRGRCEIVLDDRCISRRHCQIFLDGSDGKLRLVDGCFLPGNSNLSEIKRKFWSGCEGSGTRISLNGVFVNGRRVRRGVFAELLVGDEILFACRKGSDHGCSFRYGFVVERIVFSDVVGSSGARAVVSKDSTLCRWGHEGLVSRAVFLLSQCRSILESADPVTYLRSCLDLNHGKRITMLERIKEQDLVVAVSRSDSEKYSKLGAPETNGAPEVIGSKDCIENLNQNDVGNDDYGGCIITPAEKFEPSDYNSHSEKHVGTGYYSDGKSFFLNRLQYMGPRLRDQHAGVSLPELLQPVGSLVRVFIATFTSDVSWFLSCCQVPNHLPVTIACHSAERCWSASHDMRTSIPYSTHPNLLLVYPPFPEVIAFGKDRRKQGVACHHPKLIVLQREDSIRVVVTSANLVSKQWNNVTNTVWWQDFPCRNSPDYEALFATIEDSKSDFAAQLAGFISSLITDVPSQAHWITELTKYDFGGAACHLIASIPGVHVTKSDYSKTEHYLSAKQTVQSQSRAVKFLGSVQASVVGLSHRFQTATDSNGTQLKTLASFLGKCREKTCGMAEIFLKRNINIPADANAVSVLVADLDEFSEGDCVQLGFLPRDVAKWVSPLSDIGFFSFSGCIYPQEALAAALDGSNTKVHLILYVSQGPNFSEISRLIQPEHIVPLCSLIASMQRCFGLWRLQEVLSRYKWPESLETDFVYGSSSIGTSINPRFLASFSAVTGKRSFQFSESEESDPEWGCWNTNHELRSPSMKILFPTIERVKTGACGIQPSRRLLSLSEKTWQRLRTAGIFHDAIPHPGDRVGYPMHVKVARRRFQSKTGMSSFGWIYCGSHNFSPAAWGQTIVHSSEANMPGASVTSGLGPRLHICNYELGIIFIVPPSDLVKEADDRRSDLDDIVLPFVVPAPKYQNTDRPATAQAMREALAEVAVLEKEISQVATEEMDEDIPDEEEILEASDYFAEEKEEEKIYAEMLWSQVDSSEC